MLLLYCHLYLFSIILFSDNVSVEFYGNETQEFKGTKNGRMYLTSHRMIYNSKNNTDPLRSFSFPFIALQDVSIVIICYCSKSVV